MGENVRERKFLLLILPSPHTFISITRLCKVQHYNTTTTDFHFVFMCENFLLLVETPTSSNQITVSKLRELCTK